MILRDPTTWKLQETVSNTSKARAPRCPYWTELQFHVSRAGIGGWLGGSRVSKTLQHCSGLGVWSPFRPRDDLRIHAHICSQCRSAVKPREICTNPRNRVSTAARDPLRRSATMFATAPESRHRHSVIEGRIFLRGFPNKLGPRKGTIRIRVFPHLLKL